MSVRMVGVQTVSEGPEGRDCVSEDGGGGTTDTQ